LGFLDLGFLQSKVIEPDRIVSHTMKRDAELRGEDHIKIVFDTFLNGRTGYVFAVNPNGARYDALITREGKQRVGRDMGGSYQVGAETGWKSTYIPIMKGYRRDLT
jgi:hypothetical protein